MPAPIRTPHPESLTPRVFVTFWSQVVENFSGAGYNEQELKCYELLATGEAVEWKSPPLIDDGFNFWSIQLPGVSGTLSDINFVRPEPTVTPKADQEVLDALSNVGLKVGEDGTIQG